MAKLLKLRRGTTSQHSSFTGAEGEVTVDTDKETLVVHDGSTAGGHPVAAEDMANVSSASIAGRLSNDSIATSKIAAGALPSDVTVATANLGTTGVTAGAYGSSSAIPIVTVNNKGQVTAASTTAIDSTTIANGTSNVAVANNGNITATRSGTARLVVDDTGVDVTGTIDASGKVDCQAGLETDGDVKFNSTTTNVNVTFDASDAALEFTDNAKATFGDSADLQIFHTGSNSVIRDNGVGNLYLQHGTDNKLQISNTGVSITGNIVVSGTVDGINIATRDTLFGNLTTNNGVLKDGVTATTQAASDNSTKVATTAYVTTGIANAQAFPSGTKMLFNQTSAPTGWTKVTSNVDNRALRVVSGTVGSGGTNAFTNTLQSRAISANAGNTTQGGNISVSVGNTTAGGNVSVGNTAAGGNVSVSIANASTGGNVNSHTLTTSQMPSHSHNGGFSPGYGTSSFNNSSPKRGNSTGTGSTGGGQGHSHGFTGGSHSHNANASFSGSNHNHNANFSGNAHNHNASGNFSGSAHNHSISVGNLDLAVQYIDVIIASKD